MNPDTREQSIIEQLQKWAELKQQRPPNPTPSDYLQTQIAAKLQILNELLSLGHLQIDGEQSDVRSTIKDLGDVLQAMRDWPVDPARSFLIGDRDSDIEAAERAGVPGFKFEGGDLLTFAEDCRRRIERG